MLSLFFIRDSSGLRSLRNGLLPIHLAAMCSSLEILQLLRRQYPESLYILTNGKNNMLHKIFINIHNLGTDMRDKVQYLCDQCPEFIHQYNNEGSTPLLHTFRWSHHEIDVKSVEQLWKTDALIRNNSLYIFLSKVIHLGGSY